MFLLLETSSVCIFHFRWFPLIYYQPLGSLFIHFLHSLALCSEERLLFPGLLLKPPPTPQKTTTKKPYHMALLEDLTNIPPSILSPSLPCPLGDLTQSQGSHLSQTETLPWLAFRDAGHCFLLTTGHPIRGLCRVSNSVLYRTMSILPRFSQSASGTPTPPSLSHTLIRDKVLLVLPPPLPLRLSRLSLAPAPILLLFCLVLIKSTSHRHSFLCQSPA